MEYNQRLSYKKATALILMLCLILAAPAAVLAAGTISPPDAANTVYESAVVRLMEKTIVQGYPDGTFRPEKTITRAEVCVMVVKSMNPSAEALAGAPQKFPDLNGYEWAAPYINYAAAKGVASGYPDGRFHPAGLVTYSETAALTVAAAGFKPAELAGTWPDNVLNQAQKMGLMEGFTWEKAAPAQRGNVALMLYQALDQIRLANLPPLTNPAGKLADFSGKAYGIITETSQVIDQKGNRTVQFGFLLGPNQLEVNGRADLTYPIAGLAERYQNGDLSALQLTNGIVRAYGFSNDLLAGIGAPATFDQFGITTWIPVTARIGEVITVNLNNSPLTKTIISTASVYKAVEDNGTITGYTAATLSAVTVGSQVRLYSVTGDEPGIVEVVLVK